MELVRTTVTQQSNTYVHTYYTLTHACISAHMQTWVNFICTSTKKLASFVTDLKYSSETM